MASIVEVDEHHRVLPLLPPTVGACLVAFDSHDDLGVPARLVDAAIPALRAAAAAPPGGDGLAARVPDVDIGTWLLPAVYAGRFATVLWVSAWATNLPHADFCARLGPHAFVGEGRTSLAVVVDGSVPPAWRALWADYAVDEATLSPGERAACVAFRVIMTDAAGALAVLDGWLGSGGGGSAGAAGAPPEPGDAPPPPRAAKRARTRAGAAAAAAGGAPLPRRVHVPPPTAFALSVDLDYFSVRNPAIRALPWSDTPGFRRALIALAKRVPMERGLAFVGALEALVAGSDSPADALPAVAAAAGVDPASTAGAELLSLLASAEVRFNDGIRSLATLRGVLDTLLLAGLAEHQATHEELDALEAGLTAVVARLARGGGGGGGGGGGAAPPPPLAWPAVVARSELYTPRRQLADVRARALRAIHAGAAAAGAAATTSGGGGGGGGAADR
jgi:hypothetical protein